MKEVIAIIRLDMISETKKSLMYQGFNSLTYAKVKGRGKNKVEYQLGEKDDDRMSSTAQGHRLITKKMLTLVVADEDVEKVVETIIKTNQTGNSGDGKIFVKDITNALRVRTNEEGKDAIQ